MEIVCYTCILNQWDNLWTPKIVNPQVRYVCFTDEPMPPSPPWEFQAAWRPLNHDLRNSRLPKIMPHLHFDAEYSVWVDGCLKVNIDPVEALTRWLAGRELALFRHPCRPNVYREAEFCVQAKIGEADAIAQQVAHHRERGLPENSGLWAGGVILRRHTAAVAQFNELWWREYLTGCTRDQIALPYAVWKSGIKPASIDANVLENEWFEFMFHGYGMFAELKENHKFASRRRMLAERKQRIEALCQA